MNKQLLKSVIYLMVSVFISTNQPWSKAESQVRNNTSNDQSNYKLKKKTKHTNGDNPLILVPPPPPNQPSLLDWPGFSSMPDSLSYLNSEELNTKLEHVKKQIKNAELAKKDAEDELNENKEKANRFKSLYTEGVVSRKELEAADKEFADTERLVDDKKGTLTDLEIQQGAIVRQLNSRKHKSSHSSNSIKKHGVSSEKK